MVHSQVMYKIWNLFLTRIFLTNSRLIVFKFWYPNKEPVSIIAGMSDTPLVDLNITISPGDNMPPSIILGSPLFVEEGRKAAISKEVRHSLWMSKKVSEEGKSKAISFLLIL